jgi:alpha-galactosidase
MPAIKIMCLGGGSLYFRQVLGNFALEEELAGSDIVLYDIDAEKAELMAGLGRRLNEMAGGSLNITSTGDPDEAVDGADYALSSIGGSGAEIVRGVHGSYYHSSDLHICAKYGIQLAIGDTAGPAGMMMGLRSIPAHIDICRRMEKRCPDVVFLNHSNPMATIMRALHKYTGIKSYGLCHGVQHGIGAAAKLLELPSEELECRWIGTNHYYWFTSVNHRGRDVLPELMKRTRECEPLVDHAMTTALSGVYEHRIVYPDDGHILEFYPFATHVGVGEELPYNMADSARRHGFNASDPMPTKQQPTPELRSSFLEDYQKLLDETELPQVKEDSRSGEGPAQIITAMATGQRMVCIVNTANDGSIPNLPPSAEVEVEAVTETRGVRALVMGEAPMVLKGILEKRFVWQELVADAAVSGDRNKAMQAMMVDEMAIEPARAGALLDELLLASRDLLPDQFFN